MIGNYSTFLRVDALKMAVVEAKAGKEIKPYADAYSALKLIAPDEPEAQRDDEWYDSTTKGNTQETQRLEAQLKGYKNNLIKESIRVSWFL